MTSQRQTDVRFWVIPEQIVSTYKIHLVGIQLFILILSLV